MDLDIAQIAREAQLHKVRSNRCRVGAWLAEQSLQDRDALQDLLDDQDLQTSWLFERFNDQGFGITVLKEHRRGRCSCR